MHRRHNSDVHRASDWRSDEQGGMQRRTELRGKHLEMRKNERAEQGFGTDEWDDEVAHTRYVDDVIMLSPRYCEECLAEAIQQAYSVPFDTASQGERLEWLDMEICTETQRSGWHRENTRRCQHGHQTRRN